MGEPISEEINGQRDVLGVLQVVTLKEATPKEAVFVLHNGTKRIQNVAMVKSVKFIKTPVLESMITETVRHLNQATVAHQ